MGPCVLRVESEDSPEFDLGPHRVALGLEEDAEVAVASCVFRVEGENSPVLSLGPHRVALLLDEDA